VQLALYLKDSQFDLCRAKKNIAFSKSVVDETELIRSAGGERWGKGGIIGLIFKSRS